MLVDLMEHIVSKQLDDVAVTGLGPSQVASKFRSLIDESKLAQEPHEPAVLELAHQFTFQTVDGALGVLVDNCTVTKRVKTDFSPSSISNSIWLFMSSNSCRIFWHRA